MSLEPSKYEALIKQEADFWGNIAREHAQVMKQEWRYIRQQSHHVLFMGKHIEELLATVQPGWRVLEIGCSSGWLVLEMARRGANVEGIDVAEAAIDIARKYAAEHPPQIGSVHYRVADINRESLEVNAYDLVVALGVLHHLTAVDTVLDHIRQALRPSGLFFVWDVIDTPRINALVSGVLFMLLPTQLSYREKFQHLLRLRRHVMTRMTASIEAQGLSPFEGYGRAQHPEEQIRARFDVDKITYESAFVGYVTAQLNLPLPIIIGIGRVLALIDKISTRLGLLRGLNYILWARSKLPNPSLALVQRRSVCCGQC